MISLFVRTLLRKALWAIIPIIASLGIVFWFLPEGTPSLPSRDDRGTPQRSLELTTDTWGIFNTTDGTILAGNNTRTKRPIASITKLFTAEATLRSEKKYTPFIIEHYDVVGEGQAGKLKLGTYMTPYELLFPLLIESSNDAGEAIKRHLGGEFETTVADIQKKLALDDTSIRDATGLSSLNVSTVADLASYYAYIRQTHPHLLDITKLHTYVGEYTGYVNNDPARSIDTFSGGKHGFTDEAGRTFVGSFTNTDGTREIGIVVLKSSNLLADIQALIAYAETL